MVARSELRQRSLLARRLALAGIVAGGALLSACSPPGPPPNFVIVLADDARAADLEQLPATVAALATQGLSFERSYVTTSLCCPSRISLLTGRYAHTHGLLAIGPPLGGAPRLRQLGVESDTLATRLAARGYRTGFLGKYVYGTQRMPPSDVPPGWERWVVFDWPGYEDYRLRDGGELTHHGFRSRDYSTDLLYRKASRFLEEAEEDPRPFLLVVAPYAPHEPSTPPQRYRGASVGPMGQLAYQPLDGEPKGSLPEWATGPSAPPPVLPDLAERIADHRRSLWALDDLVARVVDELSASGRLESTWVIFTSDNGLLLGERSLFYRKHAAYEASIRVPLLVRGPGAPKGGVRDELVANIDLAPTLVELAGAPDPESFDGRSMADLWRGKKGGPGREELLVELFGEPVAGTPPPYQALRGREYLYVRYQSGECEYFDTRTDPDQLDNQCATLPARRRAELEERLGELEECRGASCW